MHKIYLLLRNNKQSGPHSLEELVQLNLKPTDLIWVEGKSFTWSYPTEMASLKPYASEEKEVAPEVTRNASAQSLATHESYMPPEENKSGMPKALTGGNVFVSMPPQLAPKPDPVRQTADAYNLEQKAEQLRVRVQAQPASNRSDREDTIQVKSSRTLDEMEEDYTSWMYKKKSAGKKFSPRLMAAAVALLLLGGTYFVIKFVTATGETADVPLTTTPVKTSDEAPQSLSMVSETIPEEITPIQEDIQLNEGQGEPLVHNAALVKPRVKSNTRVSGKREEIKAVPAKKSQEEIPENKELQQAGNSETLAKAEDDAVVSKTPRKKKKFSEKLDDFLNGLKRKKVQEPEAVGKPFEEPETSSSNGKMPERKAKRRNDETPPVLKTENIEELIDITSSEPSEKWMLGVQDLKLTLHNKSSETIKTATVEIRYYSEQNDLLETKTVVFSKIPAKKSTTMAAPDHRLANHTDYRLVSVTN
ncbi:MAG: hypothetical protein WKF97_13720 [Chitinophagaceae bacterium]